MEQQNLFTKIKNHKIWCIVVILALLGGGGFGIYKFFFQKKQPQKTVQTQQATTGTIEKTVEGSGSVTATTQNVTFSSDVTVQSVLKKDGATVKKGDQVKVITRSSSSSDGKSDMKGGMDAPSGGGMQGGNKQSGGGMPSGGRQ